MRLGFAISTSVQHDIILMDEWVGAGDADFMRRAKERMQNRVGGSKIVVLASHSTGLLRDICNRGIVLDKGRLMHAGDITSSLRYYHDLLARLRDGKELETADSAAGGAQVFGAVEHISVEVGGCTVSGWFADTEGVVPGGIALQIGSMRYPAAKMERVRRPDVMNHLGLSSDWYGFRAFFPVPGITGVADLGADLQVLGGQSPETAHAALRIAASVSALLNDRP